MRHLRPARHSIVHCLPSADAATRTERRRSARLNFMYTPAHFTETDTEMVHSFPRQHPFATLVSNGADGPEATRADGFSSGDRIAGCITVPFGKSEWALESRAIGNPCARYF